jgi:hypothetical protein
MTQPNKEEKAPEKIDDDPIPGLKKAIGKKVWNENAAHREKGPAVSSNKGLARQSLFRSDNDQIRSQIGNNKFVWQVMTPFELDGLVNPEIQAKKGAAQSASMSELKRKQEMMGDLYVDEDDDTRGCRLYDKDYAEM